MKIYSQLIISTLFLLSYSCTPKHETKSLRYNGKLICEFQYYISNGDTISDGPYRSFYKNGNLKEEINYKVNKQDGFANYYWDNGKIDSKLVFANDKLVTQIGNWDYSGKKLDSFTVVNGNGILTEYYKNGNIRRTTEMRDSTENGKTIEYDKNGKITSSITYDYGWEHGEAMKIEKGNIIKYTYKYGKEDGDFFVYDTLNNLLIKGKLRDNILVDTSFHFYTNKKIKTRVIYKSRNFTHNDSIRLSLLEGEGIMGVYHDIFMGDKGIILKISEFDSNGKQIKEEEFQDE